MLSETWGFILQTVNKYLDDRGTRMGAALAFYTILSIAPLLVIVIALAGSIFGVEAARGEVVHQIDAFVGKEGAQAVQEMIVHADRPAVGAWASVLGVITLLFGASGVFNELQDALDTIWKVKPKEGRPIWTAVKDRVFSVTLVFGTAFLLMVSLIVSAGLQAFTQYLNSSLTLSPMVFELLNVVLSFVMISLLFAMIFKYVPDVELHWRTVWVGAAITGLLFTLGKTLLGLYLGRAAVGSAYGAAGSLVAFAVWIYYSAQILLFGAEITFVVAERNHEHPPPMPNAIATSAEREK